MATAASSLFVPESLAPNVIPRFREGLGEIQALFERILEQMFGVSEGIWIGTPVNLTRERESRELELRMAEINHPHLVALHELAYDQGVWFFTMELVEGKSFLEHVRPGEKLDWVRLVQATRELASALSAQIVKPASSVMMTFAAEPNPGLDHDHFSGSAIVFLSTVTYPTRTASLR